MWRAATVLTVVLTVSLLTACGSLGELASLRPSLEPTAVTPAASPKPGETPPPEGENIQACDLVSLEEAQALSPFSTPFAWARPDDSNSSACRYNSSVDPPVDRPVAIVLGVVDFGTPDQALEALDVFREFGQENYPPVSAVPGLGGEAYSYGEGEFRGLVFAVMGRYGARIDLAGEWGDNQEPQIGLADKVQAGAAILRLALTKVP